MSRQIPTPHSHPLFTNPSQITTALRSISGILATGFVTFFALFGLASCNRESEQNKPVQSTVVVRIVHDPELRALLSSAKEQFSVDHGKLSDGTPFALELIPELNVPAAKRLASGELKAEAWITPLLSLASFANDNVKPLGAKQIDCHPLFRTPLVISAPALLTSQLHAEDGHISWNGLIEQLKVEDTAGNAPIAYSHAFPEFSASGPMAITFLAQLAAGVEATKNPLGSQSEISPERIARLQDWERLVSHYSMSESYLMGRVARSSSKRVYLSLTSEQQLWLYQRNQREEAAQLVGLFPDEGTVWSTYQLCMSDAPWVTAAHRSITSSLVNFFASPEGNKLPENFGFRAMSARAGNVASVVGDVRTPRDLGELSGKQLGGLLTRWPQLMKPAALMVVLDTSGSMEGDSLRAAKDSLRNLIPRLSSKDRVGLLTFASEIKDRVKVGGSLETLFSTLESARAIGGSAAYDALKSGVDELSAPELNGYRRTLLMITDGEGANSELSLQGIQDFLSARLARYDVNILIVGLKREGASFLDFEKIARGVNGYFREASPADLVSIIQDAMRNI